MKIGRIFIIMIVNNRLFFPDHPSLRKIRVFIIVVICFSKLNTYFTSDQSAVLLDGMNIY